MITQRSTLARLIFAANTILARPDQALAPHVQRDLAEIEADLDTLGLKEVHGVAMLIAALQDIANKPLLAGGALARRRLEAEHARTHARDHLHYIISKAGAENAGSKETTTA